MGQDLATQAGSTNIHVDRTAGGHPPSAPPAAAFGGKGQGKSFQGGVQAPPQMPPGHQAGGGKLMSMFRSRKLEEVCEIDTKAKPLGKGSFGIVLKARMKTDARDVVAVKSMEKDRMRQLKVEPKVVYNEATMMRECIGQDRFVQLYDFIDASSKYHLVMEFCEGGNLQDGAQEGDGCLAETQVQLLMRQMLEAVVYLHQKDICHRDVKPHNYMLRGKCRSEHVRVKLGDFGIATRLQRGKLLTEQMGTPAFMAPELHLLPKKSRGYDHKVDIWAVGVCMVFLLANEYPFIDNAGRLLRHKIIAGDVPLWDTSGFASLFQRFQEVAGLSRRKRPSNAGQDLTRQLLQPRREKRPSAAEALRHAWFQRSPLAEDVPTPTSSPSKRQTAAPPVDDRPLLDWGEFEQGFSMIEKELAWVVDGVVGAVSMVPVSVDASDGHRPVDRNDERLHSCVVCYMPAGDFGYVCPQCHHTVCMHCLGKLPRPMCPHCRHQAPDMAVSQFAANVMAIQAPDFNTLVDIDVPSMPVFMPHGHGGGSSAGCAMCKEPAGLTSHVTSCCGASLCYGCSKHCAGMQARCPSCGNGRQFAGGIRQYLAAGEAVNTVMGAGAEMGRSLSDGAKRLSEQWNAMIKGEDSPLPRQSQRPRSMTVPDMGVAQGLAASSRCGMCKAAGSMLDHVCPCCRHSVCVQCIKVHLERDLRCPSCGDVRHNIQSMRMLLQASAVQNSAQAMWGSITNLFTPGQQAQRHPPPQQNDPEDRLLFRGALDTQFSTFASNS
mmetsp:Transcript_75951/g.180600  ORF Transcript_75951/g.180600 Transcript_75951/m.180600 type:complete len:771 (-) Transcript_75951:148-2460(-)